MQSLTTHWQLADDLCALSFPSVFHTLHCACLAWPTRIRFATKFFVPLAACTIHHAPFAILQLPIANWNRNGKHGPKCLSIDKPSHSRCQNRCQIDAWFRCHTRCQGSSITAFALGRDKRDCRSPARCHVRKWPLGQAKRRPKPQAGLALQFRFGFGFGLSLSTSKGATVIEGESNLCRYVFNQRRQRKKD